MSILAQLFWSFILLILAQHLLGHYTHNFWLSALLPTGVFLLYWVGPDLWAYLKRQKKE